MNIVAQQFDMVAFGAGEIDAAQAMIYNEYAQVLETKNPATGKLYTPDDLNVISWEQYGTSMLQDAIFASDAWLKQTGNEDIAVKFLTASFKGWIFCRDNPDGVRGHRPQARRQAARRATRPGSSTRSTGSSGRPRTGSGSPTRPPSTARSRSRSTARS